MAKYMTHQRNTKGLADAAKNRRQDTIKKVNQAINLLLKKGKAINFNAVAKEANVGKTWLYKETEVKERILNARADHLNKRKLICNSDKINSESKDALIKMLKDKYNEVEKENYQLKKQIEILYGELCQKE